MSQEVVWLIAFGTLLLAYSLYWGIAAGRSSGKAQDFFLAGRKTPAWVFVLSATALSLTGWMVLGHPSMLSLDGFPYGEVALGAIRCGDSDRIAGSTRGIGDPLDHMVGGMAFACEHHPHAFDQLL